MLEFADIARMQQIRGRVDTVVRNQDTAEALKPYYAYLCKRPCFHDDYLETFNRRNVTLLEDGAAVSWLLDNMGGLPQVTREAIRYLRTFREKRFEIDVELAAMLANGHFSLYPSVERLIINYLLLEQVNSPKAVEACWPIVQDHNKGIVREFAARYVGRFGELGDGARLRELFEKESNQEIKRALLIALYESGECPDSLLRSLSKSSQRLGVTARYLQNSPLRVPCPNIEVI